MKKSLAIIFCLIGVNSIFAQNFTTTRPGYIGINADNPSHFLTIEGNESFGSNRTFFKLHNKSNGYASVSGMEIRAGEPSNSTMLHHHSATWTYPGLNEYTDFGQLYSRGAGLILRAGSSENPDGVIKFMTGNNYIGSSIERMRILGNGNVGIGTQSPSAKLQVTQGDVYIDNSNRGIILTSPNGNCWRVTVDNSGNLVRASVACP